MIYKSSVLDLVLQRFGVIVQLSIRQSLVFCYPKSNGWIDSDGSRTVQRKTKTDPKINLLIGYFYFSLNYPRIVRIDSAIGFMLYKTWESVKYSVVWSIRTIVKLIIYTIKSELISYGPQGNRSVRLLQYDCSKLPISFIYLLWRCERVMVILRLF